MSSSKCISWIDMQCSYFFFTPNKANTLFVWIRFKMSESAYIYALIVTTLIALALVSPYVFLLTNHVSAIVCCQPYATHACLYPTGDSVYNMFSYCLPRDIIYKCSVYLGSKSWKHIYNYCCTVSAWSEWVSHSVSQWVSHIITKLPESGDLHGNIIEFGVAGGSPESGKQTK